MPTKLYHVKVKKGHRWTMAQVGGRPFSKNEAVTLNEAQITDEIKKSALLEVKTETIPTEEELKKAAEKEAKEKAEAAKKAAEKKAGDK